jgi:uncharacterized metal-binding protein
VGLELGAMTHYMADLCSSALRRRKKKRGNSAKPKQKKLVR